MNSSWGFWTPLLNPDTCSGLFLQKINGSSNARLGHKVLRDGDSGLQIHHQVPPTRGHVQDLSFATDAFQAARCTSRFLVKRQKPFGDAQWTCHLALILRDKYTWRRLEYWPGSETGSNILLLGQQHSTRLSRSDPCGMCYHFAQVQ